MMAIAMLVLVGGVIGLIGLVAIIIAIVKVSRSKDKAS